eukprot:8287561-Lingulodinium_polyedra.AAC.1
MTPAQRATQLEEQAGRLRQIGACEETVQLVAKEAEQAWADHRAAKPLTRRLNKARQRKAAAEANLARRAQQVRDALQADDKAE